MLKDILNFNKRTLSSVLNFGKKSLSEVLGVASGAGVVGLSNLGTKQALRGGFSAPMNNYYKGFTPRAGVSQAKTLGSRVIAPFMIGTAAYKGAKRIIDAKKGFNKDIQGQIKSEEDLFQLRKRAIDKGVKFSM